MHKYDLAAMLQTRIARTFSALQCIFEVNTLVVQSNFVITNSTGQQKSVRFNREVYVVKVLFGTRKVPKPFFRKLDRFIFKNIFSYLKIEPAS